ncbi:hypothetical protein LTR22_027423 [Elasticomyces elasticus]|nr:hypothetical protein LTR22_027423 [Elasticomyces elasticus]
MSFDIAEPRPDVYHSSHGSLQPRVEQVAIADGNHLCLSDGRKIFDAVRGAAATSIGHGDKRVKKAIRNQLDTQAVERGDIAVVRQDLKDEAYMGSMDKEYIGAPRLGTEKDRADVAKAMQRPCSDRAAAALYNAAGNGHIEIVRLLLQRGAEAALPRVNGYTPINAAATNGHIKVVEVLLKQEGMDIDAPSDNGGTPLYWASQKGHDEIVRMLLEPGAEAVPPRIDGVTPMSTAATSGRIKVVEVLLRQGGVNIDAPSDEGGTPLYWAANKGHEEIVRMLLERGAEAALPRVNGHTPVSAAAVNGYIKVVEILLDH